MKRTLDRLPSTAALLSAWLCLFTLTAPAAITTWTNPFGGRWDDPGNWLFGVVPNSPNDTAIFNAREGTAFPVNILGVQSFTVRTLELNNAVGGGPIFETNPGTINLEGAAATINVQNHPVPPTVRSGVFVIIHLLNNATINTIEPDSLLNIEGLEFTGAPGVSLTKIGPGTLEFGSDTAILLTGALNAQSGTTTIFNALANAFYVGTTGSESARVGTLEIVNATVNVSSILTITSGGVLAVGTGFALNGPLVNGTFVPNGPLTASGGTIQTLAPIKFPNDVTLAAGGVTLDSNGFNSTFSGTFTGSGGLTKISPGILELTQDNTYSGATIIEDGVLVAGVPIAGQATSFALGTGDVFLNGGTLRTPSLDPVIINVGGNYTQGPGGTLAIGVAGINGSQYDHLQVGGNASLDGTLAVSSLNGFRPVSGNAFEVLRTTNGKRTGQFAQINDSLNNNPNLQRIDIYAPNAAALVYVAAAPTPTPPPGPTPTPPPGPTPTPPPGPTPSPTPNPRPPIVDVIPDPLPPVNPDKPLFLSFLLKVLNPTAEQLTSLFIPFSGANSQRFNLDNRFAEIQRGSTGFVSPLPTVPTTGKETVFQKDGKTVSQPPVFQPGPQNRWGVWVNGWGDFVSVDDDNFAKGYNFTTGGGSVVLTTGSPTPSRLGSLAATLIPRPT
jgi:autotransporter-associated beta strand protein